MAESHRKASPQGMTLGEALLSVMGMLLVAFFQIFRTRRR